MGQQGFEISGCDHGRRAAAEMDVACRQAGGRPRRSGRSRAEQIEILGDRRVARRRSWCGSRNTGTSAGRTAHGDRATGSGRRASCPAIPDSQPPGPAGRNGAPSGSWCSAAPGGRQYLAMRSAFMRARLRVVSPARLDLGQTISVSNPTQSRAQRWIPVAFPLQMAAQQVHVAAVGLEADVENSAEHRNGTDRPIQADIARHAQQHAFGHAKARGPVNHICRNHPGCAVAHDGDDAGDAVQSDRNAKDWDTPASVEQIRQPLQMSKLSVVIMSERPGPWCLLVFDDDVDGVNDTGNVSQERQQYIHPKLKTDANLKEDSQRRQQDGKENSDNIHNSAFRSRFDRCKRLNTIWCASFHSSGS